MKGFVPGWRGRSVGGFSTSGRGNPESAGTAGALCLLKVKVAPAESESEYQNQTNPNRFQMMVWSMPTHVPNVVLVQLFNCNLLIKVTYHLFDNFVI